MHLMKEITYIIILLYVVLKILTEAINLNFLVFKKTSTIKKTLF